MRTSDRGQLTATRPTGRRSSAKFERASLRREIEPGPGDRGRMTGVLCRSWSGPLGGGGRTHTRSPMSPAVRRQRIGVSSPQVVVQRHAHPCP